MSLFPSHTVSIKQQTNTLKMHLALTNTKWLIRLSRVYALSVKKQFSFTDQTVQYNKCRGTQVLRLCKMKAPHQKDTAVLQGTCCILPNK